MPIRAVTFDFWDTLVRDGSDEPARAARGLAPKREARAALFVEEVSAHHPDLDRARIRAAWAHASAWAKACWRDRHRTPTVAERLLEAFDYLGVAPTPGFDGVVRAIEDMEAEVPPEPAPHVRAALEALAGRYRLGVISDSIVTPGRVLRRVLEQHDLLRYFDAFVFSDEVGASKPDRRLFEAAARALGVQPHEILHVGDREANDVDGVLGVGGQAVLYVGCADRRRGATRAQAVCSDLARLPHIVTALDLAGRFSASFPTRPPARRRVGREAEYPVVHPDGTPFDVRTLWADLAAEMERVEVKREGEMTVGLCGPEFSYALEVGQGTMEVITGPCPDLATLGALHERAVGLLARVARAHGGVVLGYGIQPRARREPSFMSPKARYRALLESIGPDWLSFALTASDQLHVDIARDEVVSLANLGNLLAPVTIALCANSSVFEGRDQGVACGREYLMGKIGSASGRHGMPLRPASTVADLVLRHALDEHWIRRKGGKVEPTAGVFLDHAVTLDPDDAWAAYLFHEHYTWHSARPRTALATLELRAACQQPPGEHMAAAALSLAIVEAAPALERFLLDRLGDDPWPAMRSWHARVLREGLAADPPAPGLIEGVLARCQEALDARGEGEALAPLWRRLHARKNPAQQAREVFARGGAEALVRHFAWP